jgi:hypothetical protein
MKINMTVVAIVGLVFLMGGLIFQAFSMWQLDMLLVSRMWGSATGNIQYYKDLIGNNYTSMSQMPWTINVELFPNMTAGIAYDVLMIMNLSCAVLIAIGAFIVAKSTTVYQSAIRKLRGKQ